LTQLRENEQKTLLALQKFGGKATVEKITEASHLADAAIMKAALTLSNKGLARLLTHRRSIIKLTPEGNRYADKGLPERIISGSMYRQAGPIPISDILNLVDLPSGSIPMGIAWSTQKHWLTINKEKGTIAPAQKESPPLGDDERFLKLLGEKGTQVVEELDKSQQGTAITLKRRKLATMKETAIHELELTDKGWQVVRKGFKVVEEVSQLTPELIITGKWKTVKLRKFDVTSPGPPAYPGKVHPLREIVQRAREIFLEMGFTEIRGPLVETAFWNFDALFQPQDHPAREMMDTFYLSYPEKGELPTKSIVKKVAKTHEDGWTTGSKGWGYKWSAEEARKLVLRTHTTSETIQFLSRHKMPPVKVFSVDRVYRNERVDYKHLAEFHQIEGIVMAKGVTLRDLMGTLKTFYIKLGLKKIQFWPSYFPYTEPSAQATVYVPKLKAWIELCGMGMFRPEVLAPMGIEYPVLAWGGGLERLALLELEVDDVRLPYKNNLGWIRRTPTCLR
jgi:phenylalanyl-tRNA synthetase alpha chain